jgi:hypothetical protein
MLGRLNRPLSLENVPPAQHGISWTCPKTGLVIPKTLEANLAWRQMLLNEAAVDDGLKGQLLGACQASPWFWINAFCWTFRQKKVNEAGEEVPTTGHESHYPFITWKVQDEFIGDLCDAIDGGHDVLINKSRDMGASWLCLTVLHYYWQFKSSTTFLELSRKEELVDKKGSMDSLFEKHRYLLKWQPAWLRPRRLDDKYMHLGNQENGSAIEGESTNGDAGRGGRKTAILLDEFAAVPNGAAVDAATADTAACRIYNSTPQGPGTQFHKIWLAKRARILTLPWWRHPDKGRGAKQVLGDDGRPKWTSPWYEAESLRRDKKHMAQEVDMEHGKAGDMFFDADEVELHRRRHEREPVARGDLSVGADLGDESKKRIVERNRVDAITFIPSGQGEWRFWIPLVGGRPPQQFTYIFGVDIGNGTGGSNSVITVRCLETGQIVAKFWSAHKSPEKLGDVACFAGVWFGGNHAPAFMVWENNGPGGIFGRRVIKMGYKNFYFQRQEGTKREKKTQRWGWHSNNERKIVLVAAYRESLAKDRCINPCKESLDEALDYVLDENGLLIPGKMREESGGGRALHGDHVIADALTELGVGELPKGDRPLKARAPAGSFAARREARRKADARDKDEWRD